MHCITMQAIHQIDAGPKISSFMCPFRYINEIKNKLKYQVLINLYVYENYFLKTSDSHTNPMKSTHFNNPPNDYMTDQCQSL